MDRTASRIERLLSNLRWAIDRSLPPSELLPMLEQLLDLAPPDSPGSQFAKFHLARLVVGTQPWRAARLARDLLSHPGRRLDSRADEVWSILGMAHTVLGNYRAARQAHRRALDLAPDAPSHLHNLGHLLDVAFERHRDALRYLRAAHEAVPDEPELAGSYAHALIRSGSVDHAREVLLRAGLPPDTIGALLRRWASPEPDKSSDSPEIDDLEVAEG